MVKPRRYLTGSGWSKRNPVAQALALLIALGLLVACGQPAGDGPETPPVSTPASPEREATATPLLSDFPPAATEDFTGAGATPTAEANIPAVMPGNHTISTDPLRFVFPTPGPQPASAWRPPLYPAPWALFPYDHFYFARPIAADVVNWPLWDYRYGGTFFDNIVHTGIDIPAKKGTPVMAAGAGKVTWAGYGLYRGAEDRSDPYGIAVAIRHDFGYQGETLYTIYGHLDQVDVAPGMHVQAGDLLGLSGETGKVTGPHLHFEVRLGKNDYFTTQNPELWMVPPQGWGVLAGRVLNSAGERNTGQDVFLKSKVSSQQWMVKSYGPEAINSDAYYNENLVLGDIPAGIYQILIPYSGINYNWDIEIRPGAISYFTFRGNLGFDTTLPPLPGAEFTPTP